MTFNVRITHLPTNTVYSGIDNEYTEEEFKTAVDVLSEAAVSISNDSFDRIQLEMSHGVVMIPAQVAKECAFEVIKNIGPF